MRAVARPSDAAVALLSEARAVRGRRAERPAPMGDKRAALVRLKAEIAAAESRAWTPLSEDAAPWTTGDETLDARLAKPLPARGLTEIAAASYADAAAALGFAVALLARLPETPTGARDVLWCATWPHLSEYGAPCGDGLAALGLDPARLVVAAPAKPVHALWAMEEALAARSFRAVVGSVSGAGMVETRRLALAAREAGAPVLLLSGAKSPAAVSAAARWRAAAAPAAADPFDARAPGRPRAEVRLERWPGLPPARFLVEFGGPHDPKKPVASARPMRVVAELPDRAPEAEPSHEEGAERGDALKLFA